MTTADHLPYNIDDLEFVAALDELPLWSAPFALRLFELVRLTPRTVALDLGCGLGCPLLELSGRLGPSSRVVGLDPWRTALARARGKSHQQSLSAVSLVNGVAETLPFGNETFDLIVSNNGLNNVADLPRSLAECHRVTSPGAQMVVTLNLPETMIELYTVLEQVLCERGQEAAVERLWAHIRTLRPPLGEVVSMLDGAGFVLERQLTDSFSYRYANAAALFDHFLIRVAFLGGWRAAIGEQNTDDILAEVARRLDLVGEGEVRLTIPFVALDLRRVSSS